MTTTHEYDVALSFAGEDRAKAEELKKQLDNYGVKAFYDSAEDEKAKTWGENLYTYLSDIYQNKARFCLMLVSKHYADKLWTAHERDAIQARVFKEQGVYLLPVRLDDTPIPGLLPTVAFLSWPPETAESIAKAVHEKVRTTAQRSSGAKTMNPRSQKRSIITFQQSLEELYGKTNKELSLEYIYGYLSRSLGYLCRNLAHKQANETEFIRPLSWLAALSSYIGCSMEKAFVSRYPDCCPHCLELRCICRKTGKKPQVYIPAYEVRNRLEDRYNTVINSGRVIGFDAGRKIIASVYPGNEIAWEYGGPWHHIAKLYEEVSEVHEAVSGFISGKKTLAAVEEEIADVLAWVLGAWEIHWTDRSLDEEFVNYYYKGCPVCRTKPCTCKPNSSRAEGLVDPSYLTQLKGDLERLAKQIPADHKAEVDDLIRSAESALQDQNDILMRLTISQVRYKLEILHSSLGPDDKLNSGLILSILESIKTVPKWLL
ncbi:MAG TPA: TIR domain-containing protein [Pyrinomonadaceae bacterium]|nr:TIR domain-containing protein [Pyrinomonadaceae bacterium]